MGVFIVAPERTVYFAKITRDLRLWPFRDELLNAIDPLRTTSRFHRTWRFSRPIEIEGFVEAVSRSRLLPCWASECSLDHRAVSCLASFSKPGRQVLSTRNRAARQFEATP